ncbi:ATP-dependent DNA helicase-like protein mph1 [Xylogone sp. PMI_703]|nr:ATP-dependent DNA helicase-like protein mph1 [Xylogone sp. PMI_703]
MDEFDCIPDEDLIDVLSSQDLPRQPRKRRKVYTESDDSCGSSTAGDSENEENGKAKKSKYRIHTGAYDIPETTYVRATQAEAMIDSSPYRIRGAIIKKSQPQPPKPPTFTRPTPTNNAATTSTEAAQRGNAKISNYDITQELEDLPSDAFMSSPEPEPTAPKRMIVGSSSFTGSQQASQRLTATQTNLRQTTLFGGRAVEEPISASQTKKVYNYRADKAPEPPTHHVLDNEALKTWVYPTNLGAIRDYQYSIVKSGLFNNLLVALPTGLGKTFIAATIILNFFRWTKNAKIVFVAPTKPLVAQQVDACYNIAGIPRSTTTMLTGDIVPAVRADEWEAKRVFFMTPQTLDNDLRTGIADPKKIVLLVIDEAHRATGNYAYVKVVEFIRRFNQSFRVLALTATPGSTVESVQEVIDGLEIAKVEIRTEDSIDIQQFVHQRRIDQVLLDPSDEMIMIKELFSKALQPLVNSLCSQNAYWSKDPMALTPFGLIQARKSWFASEAGRRASMGLKGMMMGLFTILASVAHAIKLLNFHGVGPFYASMKELREAGEGNKGGKYRRQIIDSPDFQKMMDRIKLWLSKDNFVGHPKLTYLCDTILNHFLDAGEGRLPEGAPPSNTRVIVFSEFRDSAEDISRVLNRHKPMIRSSVFVGQADSKRSEGMNQVKQLETIRDFKSGKLNVLVATSIGEEGLDIGQVDLIVCYDASASPIRMLQRMGRTGRKRAGNIVLLLMRGKEEESFVKAKDNYEQMQKMISSGERFSFRHDLSRRIIPRDIHPEVVKRIIDIPPENTQDTSLPEPKRRAGKAQKRPAKKFHMPDGVEKGFQKASELSGDQDSLQKFGITREAVKAEPSTNKVMPLYPVESVLLNPAETSELEERYRSIPENDLQEVSMPDLTAQPTLQRTLGPVANVAHGEYTKRCVRLFKLLGDSQRHEDRWVKPYGDEEPDGSIASFSSMQGDKAVNVPSSIMTKKSSSAKEMLPPQPAVLISDDESGLPPRSRKPTKTKKRATHTRKPRRSREESDSDGEDIGYGNHQHFVASSYPEESFMQGEEIRDSETASEDYCMDEPGSLDDFVVATGQVVTSPATGRSLFSSQTSVTSTDKDARSRSVFKRTQVQTTQGSEDDMPDIAELINTKKRHISRQDIESDEDFFRPVTHRSRGRRVIEDDSDE